MKPKLCINKSLIKKIMAKPLVSIIMPTYNSEKYIKDTIESILAQTYINWELLITDDSSTDNTIMLIKTYQAYDKRINLFTLSKNKGAAIARNNSISNSNGRFIAFCDSDDTWNNDKLEKQIGFMLNNNFHFSFSYYNIIDEDNNLLKKIVTRDKVTYNDLLITCDIGCLTAVYDVEHFGKNYMYNIRKRQDYTLWLKLLKRTKFAYAYKESLANYRYRKGSISSNKFSALCYVFKVFYKIENIGFLLSLYYTILYGFFGFLKYKRVIRN